MLVYVLVDLEHVCWIDYEDPSVIVMFYDIKRAEHTHPSVDSNYKLAVF